MPPTIHSIPIGIKHQGVGIKSPHNKHSTTVPILAPKSFQNEV